MSPAQIRAIKDRWLTTLDTVTNIGHACMDGDQTPGVSWIQELAVLLGVLSTLPVDQFLRRKRWPAVEMTDADMADRSDAITRAALKLAQAAGADNIGPRFWAAALIAIQDDDLDGWITLVRAHAGDWS
jgi:hypothetical protein